MKALPAPLVPAHLDLRRFPDFFLNIDAFENCDTLMIAAADNALAGIAAIRLWVKSQRQLPAGSLPNDDKIIAKLAGLDGDAWRDARHIAMRGWVLCSDGRLYHKYLSKRLRALSDGGSDDERKARQAARQKRYRERMKAAGKEAARGISASRKASRGTSRGRHAASRGKMQNSNIIRLINSPRDA